MTIPPIEFGEPDQAAQAHAVAKRMRGGEKSGHETELCFSPRARADVTRPTTKRPDAFGDYHKIQFEYNEHPERDEILIY